MQYLFTEYLLTLQLGLTCSLFKPSVSEIREMQGLMYFATRNLVVLLTFKLENSKLFYSFILNL